MSTDLYRRTMEWAEHNLDAEGASLMHKVWDATPWMVEVYTGRMAAARDSEMRDWCCNQFGDEAWPIHGRSGAWCRGSATVFGWTWFGFAEQGMMERFMAVWPAPDDAEAPREPVI